MTKKKLIEELHKIHAEFSDKETKHMKLDNLLLKYINNEEVTRIFNSIEKWYA